LIGGHHDSWPTSGNDRDPVFRCNRRQFACVVVITVIRLRSRTAKNGKSEWKAGEGMGLNDLIPDVNAKAFD
jgi:hypothetical protein